MSGVTPGPGKIWVDAAAPQLSAPQHPVLLGRRPSRSIAYDSPVWSRLARTQSIGKTTTLDTRDVSKCFVGLRVEAFGPTRVSGTVSQAIPDIPGS